MAQENILMASISPGDGCARSALAGRDAGLNDWLCDLAAAEFRMAVMPIAEIIHEIDAYVSRLRQARELLSAGREQTPAKRAASFKNKVIASGEDPGFSIRRRTDENKSQSKPSAGHLKRVKQRVDKAAELPTVDRVTAQSEQSAAAGPERTIPQSVVVTRLPAGRRRFGSIRSVPRRPAKQAASAKEDAIRPAIALARPMHTKIVVVPAEQVRRERERSVQPEVPRPRVPSSGMTGRLAFEALFSDGSEPTKTSGK